MGKLRVLAIGLILLLAMLPTAWAQVSGQLSGTVVDSSGSVIPGAKVSVTHVESKQVRTYETQANGTFLFPGLLTGVYNLHVEKAGFRSYNENAIVVASQENVDLHEVRMQVGEISQAVTVEAEAARIQTETSDRISTLARTTVEELPNPSRSFLAPTRTVPGSQSTSTTGGGTINGGQTGQLVLQLDGIIQQDSGAPSANANVGRFLFNVDAVNEVQIQVNAMNAEFGSRGGGQILVTTRQGSSRYHGGVYGVLRNEDFNANTFFNNKTGVVRPRSRFQNYGGTFGGPVWLPKLPFNRGSEKKMFFFYAEDQLYNKNSVTNSYSMPTALEKAGDFSQTVTTAGVQIPITDPLTGKQFPNNVIPSPRFSKEGVAMLNLFPTPGGGANSFGLSAPLVIDPTGNRAYNTLSSFGQNAPQTTRTLRVDYNLGAKTTMYVRLLQSLNNNQGVGVGQVLGGTNWGELANTNPQNARGYVASLIHTFRPNLIGEFTMGENFIHQQNQPLDSSAYFKAGDLSNFKLPDGTPFRPVQVFSGNFQNLIPNILFTGNRVQSAGQGYSGTTPAFGFDNRWPFDGTDLQANYTGGITWIKGAHRLKAGFYLEHNARNVSVYSVYNTNGTYYFGSDKGNPLDTNYPISNLLTGAIQSYGQDNVKQINHARYYQYEWYLQDTWRVSRRLSLDYGVRFAIIPQMYSTGVTLGLFDASLYNASKTGQLLIGKCLTALPANGTCTVPNTVAVNPVTGATYNGGQIGLFDPKSYAAGSFPYSGIRPFPDGHLFDTQPPQIGPRFGFAYDAFGNGRLAIRGAFGMFYQRGPNVDQIASDSTGVGPLKTPPTFQAPSYFNTTFAGLAGAQSFFGPQSFNGGSTTMPNPVTYNWNFDMQFDIGKGFVLDAAYVGNVAHHQLGFTYNANGIPVGTTWSPNGGTCNAVGNCTGTLNPAYLNPVQTSQPLPINLLRAKIGYNGLQDLTSYTAAGESGYNALQVQINRRFSKRLTLTSNWTWQKTITFSRNQYLPDILTKNVANRKQAVNVNLNYAIPSLAALLGNNAFTKAVFDGWHVDSVMSFFSGNPLTVSCAVPAGAPAGYPNGQAGVGGALPFRCAMTGPLFLDAGATPAANGYPATVDPRLWYPINIKSFPLPALSTYGVGNTPPTLFWGPGYENVDMSVYKSFKVVKEGYELQLRADATNVFNHFNPSDPNRTLTYNYATNAQQTANFGQITAQTGGARVMSTTLRFRF